MEDTGRRRKEVRNRSGEIEEKKGMEQNMGRRKSREREVGRGGRNKKKKERERVESENRRNR